MSMHAIQMGRSKYKEMSELLKTSYQTLRDMKASSGTVTDKSENYGKLNVTLEQVIRARSMFVSSARKFSKRKGVKEALEKIDFAANRIQSVLDAMENREATGKMLASLSKEVSPSIRESHAFMKGSLTLSEDVSSNEPQKKPETLDELVADKKKKQEAKEKQKQLAQRLSMEDARRQAQRVFNQNKRHKEKLPNAKTTEKTLVVMRVPVIPIFKKIISPQELQQIGFDVKPVGLYAILENQVVVGINYRYTAENNIKNKDHIKEIGKMLTKKTGHVYHPLDDLPVKYAGTGFLYYWMIDAKDYDRLTRSGIREASIQQWGFAF